MGVEFNKMYEKIREKEKGKANKFLKDYYKIDKYRKVIVIDTLDEFVCVLNYYCSKSNEKYVFRGLSRPDQKYSKITRGYNPPNNEIDKKNEIDYYINNFFNKEILHIREFEQKAGFLLQNYVMPIDLIAAAAHYGVKTRFIDWTTSPLIATLFSLNGAIDILKGDKSEEYQGKKYYLVLATDMKKHINVHNLTTGDDYTNKIDVYSNRYIIYEKMILELMEIYKNREKDRGRVEKYFQNVLSQTHTEEVLREGKGGLYKDKTDKFMRDSIIFLETNFTNERIVNQRGLFQIAVSPTEQYMDNLIKKMDVIMVSENIKEEIIDYCKKLGVNYYGLMPDPQTIAQRINEKYGKRS